MELSSSRTVSGIYINIYIKEITEQGKFRVGKLHPILADRNLDTHRDKKKNVLIPPSEYAQVWEGNEGAVRELKVVKKNSESDTRMIAAHQQCRRNKGKVGHTLPENGNRRKKRKWQYSFQKMGNKRLSKKSQEQSKYQFNRADGPLSGILW